MSELKNNTTPQVDLSAYNFNQAESPALSDLRQLDPEDRTELLMAGVDVEEEQRSGTFLQIDHSNVHCSSRHQGVEVLSIKNALEKYNGLPEYY